MRLKRRTRPIFVGGTTSAALGTMKHLDGEHSCGTSVSNYVFGGLNVASTLGYAITTGVAAGWRGGEVSAYLVWPMLAHAALATANFVIGSQLAEDPQGGANAMGPGALDLRITPFGGHDARLGDVAGLSLAITTP